MTAPSATRGPSQSSAQISDGQSKVAVEVAEQGSRQHHARLLATSRLASSRWQARARSSFRRRCVASISVGNVPSGVAVSPDGSVVYVTNFTDKTLSVISAATNTVITTVSLSGSPADVAVSADGTRIYISDSTNDSVAVISFTPATP